MADLKSPSAAPSKPTEVPEVSKETLQQWEAEANDDKDDSQVKLGGYLLKLADSDVDREENSQKAIHWLVQASKQGNDDATKQLGKCLKTKTGITSENREDVQWCVDTSNFEKKVRSASRGLFNTLSGTHQKVMSLEEYITAVKKVSGGDVLEEKLLIAAGKKIGDNISETEFAKVLSKKIQGKITLTSSEKDSQSAEYKSAGIITKVIKHPKATAMVLFDEGLEWVSDEGLKFGMSLIPTNQLYLLGVFFLYSFISTKLLFLVVPLIVFYIAIAIMVISTLQMFYKSKKLRDATAMANVLKNYDVGVNVDDTKSQYTWNSLTPYLIYFGALPFLIVSFSLANKLFIPCSELMILSGALSAVCFSALSDSHDLITLMALGCNFLASLPTFFHAFPDIPVITPILHLVTGSFFSIELGYGFSLNFGIPSLSHIVIGIFFIVMAMQKSFSGVYRVLVPHLICYFWWNFMTSLFPFTSWTGLARASIGYLFLPLLFPFILLAVIGGFLYCLYYLFRTELFGKVIITLLMLAVPVLLTQTKALFGKKTDKQYKSVKTIVMVVFGVLAFIPLAFIRLPSFKVKGKLNLSWEDYSSICVNRLANNTAPSQMQCSHFIGQKVVWEGTFVGAKVTKIENSVAPLLSSLPGFIADQLRCIYGEDFGDCDSDEITENEKHVCQLMKAAGRDCHLKKHDTFSFSANVEMPDSVMLSLDVGDAFKAVIAALEEGDKVKVTATLHDGLGTKSLHMKLKNINCVSRELPVMELIDEEDDDEIIEKAMNEAVTVAFNFFWYPLVEYAP
ncbi:wolframin-like [Mizuhopecten yessoensis]|uniref:Wolframin n=1 Tax=Mizuhopecten yessoensis TaxID=6573 RepID=A0A210PU61_MIZYE|nr:wolframin-like [Mizuhopecten yessoensis]OWF40023.1 Wolframin [Mizuhopecten yessoensis]